MRYLLLFFIVLFTFCYTNVDTIKKAAPEFLKERGYKIISYDGYESDIISGGFVAYLVKDTFGYIYSLEIQKWKDEFHIYNQKCLNALSK